MSSLSDFAAFLSLVVSAGAAEQGFTAGVSKPTWIVDQPLGRTRPLRGASVTISGIGADNRGGIPAGSLYPEQEGPLEDTGRSWDLDQTLPTQPPTLLGTKDAAPSQSTMQHESKGDADDGLTFQHAPGNNEWFQQQRRRRRWLQRQQRRRQRQQQQLKQQHRVPLRNMDNVQYFGEMMMGEPPQRMKVLFDTGSSDTWVPGVGCTTCGIHSAFNDLASLTAEPMGRNFSNRYDSGSVKGSVIKERVLVGGMSVEDVEMGLVQHQEQNIRGFRADGIIGLAFPSISTNRNTSPSQHSTFVELLQEQFGGVGDIFSVYLTPFPNQPGSMVIFGGYDLDLVRRPPQKTISRNLFSLINSKRSNGSNGRLAAEKEEVHSGLRGGGKMQPRLQEGATAVAGHHQQDQQEQLLAHRTAMTEGGGSNDESWAGRGLGANTAAAKKYTSSGNYNGKGLLDINDGRDIVTAGLTSAGKLGMRRAGEGDGQGVVGASSSSSSSSSSLSSLTLTGAAVAAATVEAKQNVVVTGMTGGQDDERKIKGATADINQEEEDEPVIVWTPVIEYRGSLSYWTVEMTGWRTEKYSEGMIGGSDAGESTAATVGMRLEGPVSGEKEYGDVGGGDGGDETMRGFAAVAGRELCPTGCQAIVDTGSSLLVPPRSHYQAVMQQITGGRPDCKESKGLVSCSRCSLEEFPDIVISVAVVTERRNTREAASRPTSAAHGFHSTGKIGVEWPRNERQHRDGDGGGGHDSRRGDGDGTSGSAGGAGGGEDEFYHQELRLKPSDYLTQSWDGCEILVGEGTATDIWTLGDAFIKTYMTIFDVANLRVGFVCADGGRCLGGASPRWLPRTTLCWPFLGSAADPIESIDTHGTYCLYLHFNSVGWVLLAASALLFVAGCLLYAEDAGSTNGGGGGGNANSVEVSAPSSSSPSERNSSRSNPPPFNFLITGQDEQCRQKPLRHPPGAVVSGGNKTENARGGVGEDGGNAPIHRAVEVGGGAGKAKGTLSERECDGNRNESSGEVVTDWARALTIFLRPFLNRFKGCDAVQSSLPPTRSPFSEPSSRTKKHAVADKQRPHQFWNLHERDGAGGSAGVSISTVASGTLSRDGMRSRAGTPRSGRPSRAPIGGGHH